MAGFNSTHFDNAAYTFTACGYGALEGFIMVQHMARALGELTQGVSDNLKLLFEQTQALGAELARLERVVGQIKQIVTPAGHMAHTTARTPGLK
jgi:hypothetical protein